MNDAGKLIISNDSFANFSYDYYEYMDEQDFLANDPIVRNVAAVTLLIYFIAVIVGIPANIYVLIRMRKLAKNDRERYRNGTGIALCSMAAADLCSLLLILSQNLMQLYPQLNGDEIFMHYVCKVVLFLTHTVTGISVWSWLLLSTLRYLAIRHPLFHLRLWQMPCRALSFIVIVSMALNAWLLFAVQSTQFGCTQHAIFRSIVWNRLFHIIECTWSFCVPFLLIFIMDISVLIKSTTGSCNVGLMQMFSTQKKSELILEPLTIDCVCSKNSQILTRHKHNRTLWRWLAIALICIILNTPENMYRLVILFGMPNVQEEALHFSARMLAQALYFSQFAFNAVYLALFVFDKSTRPKSYFEHSIGRNFVPVCQSSKCRKVYFEKVNGLTAV
uniref:G_PROTEIN_RECEP_F1_2 domain-containing protein n=1 Tax=Onchocerca volvulus TaxID=6282 RepID=A0A8R1TR47_ONCVO